MGEGAGEGMKFIEIADGNGARHLVPLESISHIYEVDEGKANIQWGSYGSNKRPAEFQFNIVTKDRYDDVIKFIQQAGGVVMPRQHRTGAGGP